MQSQSHGTMVVFLDLDDETLEPDEDPRLEPFSSARLYPANGGPDPLELGNDTHTGFKNSDSGFAAALACYP